MTARHSGCPSKAKHTGKKTKVNFPGVTAGPHPARFTQACCSCAVQRMATLRVVYSKGATKPTGMPMPEHRPQWSAASRVHGKITRELMSTGCKTVVSNGYAHVGQKERQLPMQCEILTAQDRRCKADKHWPRGRARSQCLSFSMGRTVPLSHRPFVC